MHSYLACDICCDIDRMVITKLTWELHWHHHYISKSVYVFLVFLQPNRRRHHRLIRGALWGGVPFSSCRYEKPLLVEIRHISPCLSNTKQVEEKHKERMRETGWHVNLQQRGLSEQSLWFNYFLGLVVASETTGQLHCSKAYIGSTSSCWLVQNAKYLGVCTVLR